MCIDICNYVFVENHIIVYDGAVMFTQKEPAKEPANRLPAIKEGVIAMMPKWKDEIQESSLCNLLTWVEGVRKRQNELFGSFLKSPNETVQQVKKL